MGKEMSARVKDPQGAVAPRGLSVRWMTVVLGLVLLAGCVGSEVPAADPARSAEGLDVSVVADPVSEDGAPPVDAPMLGAPVWLVGDAWSVMSVGGAEDSAETLVVTSATPDSYTIETTGESTAGYDAMFDVSFIGKIRARDLAGHQQDQPVQFFDFPLEDGKTWVTAWDGLEVTLMAKKAARGFDITGTVDGEPYVTYGYDPALKWWPKLEFAGGYGIRVEKLVSGWTGELKTATAKVVFESGPAAPVATPGSGSFTIDEGQAFGMVSATGAGTAWVRGFWLIDPSGTSYFTGNTTNVETMDPETVGQSDDFGYSERIPAMAGEWRILAPTLHDPSGWGSVTVHQVAIASKQFP